jgi:hypothetical protein
MIVDLSGFDPSFFDAQKHATMKPYLSASKRANFSAKTMHFTQYNHRKAKSMSPSGSCCHNVLLYDILEHVIVHSGCKAPADDSNNSDRIKYDSDFLMYTGFLATLRKNNRGPIRTIHSHSCHFFKNKWLSPLVVQHSHHCWWTVPVLSCDQFQHFEKPLLLFVPQGHMLLFRSVITRSPCCLSFSLQPFLCPSIP